MIDEYVNSTRKHIRIDQFLEFYGAKGDVVVGTSREDVVVQVEEITRVVDAVRKKMEQTNYTNKKFKPFALERLTREMIFEELMNTFFDGAGKYTFKELCNDIIHSLERNFFIEKGEAAI